MIFLRLCTVFVLFAAVVPTQADESAKLSATIDAALDVIYMPDYEAYSLDQKQAEVRKILENNYDLEVVIRRSV